MSTKKKKSSTPFPAVSSKRSDESTSVLTVIPHPPSEPKKVLGSANQVVSRPLRVSPSVSGRKIAPPSDPHIVPKKKSKLLPKLEMNPNTLSKSKSKGNIEKQKSGTSFVPTNPPGKMGIVGVLGTTGQVKLSERKAPKPVVSSLTHEPLERVSTQSKSRKPSAVSSHFSETTSVRTDGISHTTMQDMYISSIKQNYCSVPEGGSPSPLFQPGEQDPCLPGYSRGTEVDILSTLSSATGSLSSVESKSSTHTNGTSREPFSTKQSSYSSYRTGSARSARNQSSHSTHLKDESSHSRFSSRSKDSASPHTVQNTPGEQVLRSSSLKLNVDLTQLQEIDKSQMFHLSESRLSKHSVDDLSCKSNSVRDAGMSSRDEPDRDVVEFPHSPFGSSPSQNWSLDEEDTKSCSSVKQAPSPTGSLQRKVPLSFEQSRADNIESQSVCSHTTQSHSSFTSKLTDVGNKASEGENLISFNVLDTTEGVTHNGAELHTKHIDVQRHPAGEYLGPSDSESTLNAGSDYQQSGLSSYASLDGMQPPSISVQDTFSGIDGSIKSAPSPIDIFVPSVDTTYSPASVELGSGDPLSRQPTESLYSSEQTTNLPSQRPSLALSSDLVQLSSGMSTPLLSTDEHGSSCLGSYYGENLVDLGQPEGFPLNTTDMESYTILDPNSLSRGQSNVDVDSGGPEIPIERTMSAKSILSTSTTSDVHCSEVELNRDNLDYRDGDESSTLTPPSLARAHDQEVSESEIGSMQQIPLALASSHAHLPDLNQFISESKDPSTSPVDVGVPLVSDRQKMSAFQPATEQSSPSLEDSEVSFPSVYKDSHHDTLHYRGSSSILQSYTSLSETEGPRSPTVTDLPSPSMHDPAANDTLKETPDVFTSSGWSLSSGGPLAEAIPLGEAAGSVEDNDQSGDVGSSTEPIANGTTNLRVETREITTTGRSSPGDGERQLPWMLDHDHQSQDSLPPVSPSLLPIPPPLPSPPQAALDSPRIGSARPGTRPSHPATKPAHRPLNTEDILNEDTTYPKGSLAEYLARTKGPVTFADLMNIKGEALFKGFEDGSSREELEQAIHDPTSLRPAATLHSAEKESVNLLVSTSSSTDISDNIQGEPHGKRYNIHHFCSMPTAPSLLPRDLQVMSMKTHAATKEEQHLRTNTPALPFTNSQLPPTLSQLPPTSSQLPSTSSQLPFSQHSIQPLMGTDGSKVKLIQLMDSFKVPSKVKPTKSIDAFQQVQTTDNLPPKKQSLASTPSGEDESSLSIRGVKLRPESDDLNLVWRPAPPKFSLHPTTVRQFLFPNYKGLTREERRRVEEQVDQESEAARRLRYANRAFRSLGDLTLLREGHEDKNAVNVSTLDGRHLERGVDVGTGSTSVSAKSSTGSDQSGGVSDDGDQSDGVSDDDNDENDADSDSGESDGEYESKTSGRIWRQNIGSDGCLVNGYSDRGSMNKSIEGGFADDDTESTYTMQRRADDDEEWADDDGDGVVSEIGDGVVSEIGDGVVSEIGDGVVSEVGDGVRSNTGDSVSSDGDFGDGGSSTTLEVGAEDDRIHDPGPSKVEQVSPKEDTGMVTEGQSTLEGAANRTNEDQSQPSLKMPAKLLSLRRLQRANLTSSSPAVGGTTHPALEEDDFSKILQEVRALKKQFLQQCSLASSTDHEDLSDIGSTLSRVESKIQMRNARRLVRRPQVGRPSGAGKGRKTRRTKSAELRASHARRKLSRPPRRLPRSTSFPMMTPEMLAVEDDGETTSKRTRRLSAPLGENFTSFMKEQGGNPTRDDHYQWAMVKWDKWFDEVYAEYRAIWEEHKRGMRGMLSEYLSKVTSQKDVGPSQLAVSEQKREEEEEQCPELENLHFFILSEPPDKVRRIQVEIEKLDASISSGPPTDTLSAQLCRRGSLLRQVGKLKSSKEDLDRCVQIQPRFSAAYFQRHLLFLIQGNEKAALKDLSSVLKFNERHTLALQSKATMLHAGGALTEALDLMNKAVQCSPNNAGVHMFRGQLLDEKGSSEQAVLDYSRAAELDQSNTEGLMKQAMHYYRKKYYMAACKAFTRLLERDPNNSDARVYRAQVEGKMGDYATSLEDLSAVIHLCPNNYEPFFLRGCLIRRTHPKKALKDFSTSLLLNDSRKNIAAYLHRGILYAEMGRYDEALTDYDIVVQMDPTVACAYVNMGLIYFSKYGIPGRGISYFTRAVKTDPTYVRAYLCRAEAHMELKEYRPALRDLTTVLHLKPDEPSYYLMKGYVHLMLSEYDLAEEYVRVSSSMSGPLGTLPVRDAAIATFLGDSAAAENILLDEVRKNPSAEKLLLLGKIYEKDGKFMEAFDTLSTTLKSLVAQSKCNKPTQSSIVSFCGDCLMHVGEHVRALGYLNRAVRLNPKNAQAYYLRSICKLKTHNTQHALADINKSLTLDPSQYEVSLKRASMFCRQGRVKKAVFNCGKAIELQPNSARAYMYRGCYRMMMSQYKEALVDLSHAAKLCPSSSMVYFNRAVCHQALRHFKDAIEDYTESLDRQKHPSVKIFVNRGLVRLQVEDYTGSLEDFIEAAKLSPTDPTLYQAIGLCYHNLKELDLSVEAYTKAVRLNPFFWEAFIGRGNAHLEHLTEEGMRLSMRDYLKVLHTDPFNIPARINTAYLLQMQGKLRQAWDHFSVVLIYSEGDPRALEGRAIVSLQAGYLDGALSDINHALRVSRTPELLTNRGVIHEYMDDSVNAGRDYTEAVQVDSSYHLAHFNMGNLYFHHRQFQQAIESYTRAISLHPSSESPLVNRAICLSIQGLYSEALDDLSRAAEVNNCAAHIFYNRGNIYRTLGQYNQAEMDYMQALSLQPDDYLSKAGLQNLETLKKFAI